MIRLFLAVKRLPALTATAFLDHWRDIHRPLILRHANALFIRSYEQIAPLAEDVLTARGARANAGWDGVAVLGYDAREAHLRPHETDAGRAALAEIRRDEAAFIDRTQTISWWGEPLAPSPMPNLERPVR